MTGTLRKLIREIMLLELQGYKPKAVGGRFGTDDSSSGGGGYGYDDDWASDDYAVFGDHPGEYAETDDDGDDGDDGDE